MDGRGGTAILPLMSIWGKIVGGAAGFALGGPLGALLGAAALGDIGRHFPDTDARWQGADSRALLRQVLQLLQQGGFCIVNIDATIIAEQPKMAPHIPAMVANVAADLGLSSAQVNIKAKTFERIGALGRGEGIAVEAIALLQRSAA